MVDGVDEQKRSLRASIRSARRQREPHTRAVDSERLTDQLIRLIANSGAGRIACFMSRADEPDTSGAMKWAVASGIAVIVPVARADGDLDWVELDDSPRVVSELGIEEPTGPRLGVEAVQDVGLVLIPAAAVDRGGMRLGWGKGFYDRTLEHLRHTQGDVATHIEAGPPVFAVVFENELVDNVPALPHDRAVDGVITPAGVTRF